MRSSAIISNAATRPWRSSSAGICSPIIAAATSTWSGPAAIRAIAGSGYGLREWEWDLISEWTLPDEAALQEIYRIMQEPGIDELFHADEDRFIDRTATVTVPCEVRGGGNSFDPKGTVFDTPDGVPRWD